MSENLNRSTEGFSKYDSMSIGELEEILRADAVGPERDDSDVDEILYVMEVLAKKRRQNDIAGMTALEAYQEFQQHYLSMVEEESAPKRNSNIIPFRRIAAVAASLVLVFTLTTSANAFGWKDIWKAVAKWAEETFSFSTGVEVSEPKADSELEYESLQDALSRNARNDCIIPTWVPVGYELVDVIVDRNPMQDSFVALYTKDNLILKISAQSFLENKSEQIESSGILVDTISISGIEYYIFRNNDLLQAAWIADSFECYIAGEITLEEIKLMIASISEGK